MAIREALLPEYDHEMANTRKLLERLPDDRATWKPHEKSMTLHRLATHVVEIPGWVTSILDAESFDVAPAGGTPRVPPSLGSRQDFPQAFDKNVASARAKIAAQSDAEFMTPWSLKNSGRTVLTLPRAGVVRSMLLNHLIHHRAQLGVYLRLQNVPLPSLYGPSADES